MSVFDAARQSVDAYSENAEAWKPDHDLAMACCRFEGLLRNGIDSLNGIIEYHTSWQEQVMSGQVEPDLSMDQAIWDMYARWLRPCEQVSKELAFFEQQGFEVKNSAEFRELWSLLREDLKGLLGQNLNRLVVRIGRKEA